MQDNQPKQSMAVPIAIVLAGALVGFGIFFSGNNTNQNQPVSNNPVNTAREIDINIRPVSASDHIKGSINAPIILVEYSDTECPFCKSFHTTLQFIMAEYGPTNKLAWVYRHFPIAQLHPNAAKQSQATECAAEQGKFWEYTDELYRITPSNNGLLNSQLPEIASTVGLDVDAFNACLSSSRHIAEINQSITDAQNAGANGTPTSFMILSKAISQKQAEDIALMSAPLKLPDNTPLVQISLDRKTISMSGAIPGDFIKGIIETVLRN